ncbi:LacI family DNA-binding transcriptional regulator [Lentilactobacillus sp. IMAU92037]|uniref:LacI family DNA-binding transcriptional regulator n=1 Tax=Lentilactobacillus TaxID=2767893 RepID=UPI001C27671A|nr:MULTISPECIES: LacI family DNA-binding transcriptional regulator [Lentilactobacillus]MBU9789889.1 LacI family DNA-binding transcriptional regulator [Lentilactobacillus dabitei]MBV0930786.1 LacI family DNA-binding transcriptional regulator [Lentilactobacillus dabitei]MDM7517023.1 LacI family DNA-binding transcriptional regulator [Lentilactobacillus sp. TOM.63]
MATIRDIAKKLGLSVSTVSRALNDNQRISVRTRRQVKEVAEDMGYQPNYNARNLTNQEANSVGVIFPVNNRVVDNIFYVGLLRGINEQLNARNYVLSVAIGESTEQVLDNVKSMINRAQIKRFILLYSHENDPVIELLQAEPVEFVTIGKPAGGQHWLYVDNDNVEAGADGVDYLMKWLHVDNPVFAESTNNWPYEIDRKSGYLREMKLAHKTPVIFPVPDDDEAVVNQFIEENPQMDGVVAIDDFTGLKVYHRFKLLHPDREIEVVGYNNSLPNELTDQHFHSVDLNPNEMGRSAVKLLFQTEKPKRQHIIVSHAIQK